MKVLVLRFDAPLVSFGAPAIDQNGVVQVFPALSMLTGLLANALGWDHRDADRLDVLQERVRYAARIDRQGEALVDYQSVDLGSDWMLPEKAGWTTRGQIAGRGKSENARGTHIRLRHYRADSLHTVALTLIEDQVPTINDVAEALRSPARPLFIGRKCCLPAAPILLNVVEGTSLVGVLASIPRPRRSDTGRLRASWDGDDSGAAGESRVIAVTDERDWRSRVHVGRRLMREGHVDPPEAARV
ncbi:MAG: type I-E CRISPR-associated protein Cas5/CasD [Vicinamibacterales bacterium]